MRRHMQACTDSHSFSHTYSHIHQPYPLYPNPTPAPNRNRNPNPNPSPSPNHYQTDMGHLEIIEYLLTAGGADPTQTNTEGNTLLLVCISSVFRGFVPLWILAHKPSHTSIMHTVNLTYQSSTQTITVPCTQSPHIVPRICTLSHPDPPPPSPHLTFTTLFHRPHTTYTTNTITLRTLINKHVFSFLYRQQSLTLHAIKTITYFYIYLQATIPCTLLV